MTYQPKHPPDQLIPPHLRLSLAAGLAALALVCVAAAPALAQAPASSFGDTVEVSEVILDVLVTDRDGNVVLGLDTADFIIEEQGEDREPTGVSFYSNRFKIREGEEGIQDPLPNEIVADRYFILFFHDPRLAGSSLQSTLLRRHLDATHRSRQWVESEKLPGDWVAVVSYDVKLKVQQDFTQDTGALLAAIDNAARGRDPRNEFATRRPEVAPGTPSLLAHLPEGKALRKETTRMYSALEVLAEATQTVLGRKNILLFTLGWGEIEQFGGLISQPDPRYYPEMRQALNDHNVAVYPIYLLPEVTRNAQGHFLNLVARDTGGQYFENFVNFITPIKEIADEANGYYLLSYLAEHPSGEVGYREVEVRTRNPELQVKARKGYRFGA